MVFGDRMMNGGERTSSSLPEPATQGREEPIEAPAVEPLLFAEVYDRYFDFVWRAARRLGVGHEAVDDIAQETFLVVHRRLTEPRTGALRAWIYGITVHTVRNHRRSLRRKATRPRNEEPTELDALPDLASDGPERHAQKAEAIRALYAILHQLDDDRREVFVLVELEQLSAPEAASALGMNLNTVYSRLRLARAEFDAAVRRHLARDERRTT